MDHPRCGRLGLPADRVVPRGLTTPALESFTGYAARIGARIAVPAATFLGRALADARSQVNVPAPTTVQGAARYLNAGDPRSDVSGAVEALTGHPGLSRLSYLAFSELFGVDERTVLAVSRRWCPACWPS